MLIPEQVVPFLLHEEWTLRHHAQRYIEGANPVAPLTADHMWEAAGRVDEREAASYYRLLREAPQTERSWQRMRDRLAGHVNSVQGHHLQHAAGTIDWGLLRSHREEILGCASLLPHVRHHLEQRLVLADQPPTEAWDQLMQHGRELGGRNVGRFDDRLSRRLIEAAARQPGELIERAIQTMNDPAAAEDWRQIFAVQFLGAVHPERAIDPLVEQFSVDADYLRERVCDALVAIGSPEVVQKVRAFYPAASWDARLYARDVFGRIKRAESEAALAELIELEQDEELLVMLLQELCQLESLCGLERSRELIASDSRNPEHEDLAAALLAASIMSGVELPEARAWGKIAGRLQAKYRAALQDFGDDLSADFRETWGRTGQILPDSDGDRDSDDSIGMDASAPPPYEPAFSETFRREGPKIGRNDPCPCGSGKKYKKCCGANA